MAVVAFSASRLASLEELQPFERLAIRLSSSFATLDAEDVEQVVARALEDIGTSFGVDQCTLIAFGEAGATTVVASWATYSQAACTAENVAAMPWLTQQLARNAVAATTAASDAASTPPDGARATRTDDMGRLAVPIALDGRVLYGLLVGNRQQYSEWRTAFVERLRLVAEILGGGLERRRQVEVLRGGPAPLEPLAKGAKADTQYLREEARDQAEADQIIGDSASLRVALARLGQVAPLDATVLLLGETGTGKELFARALHDRSRRRRRMLVRVNCAALPASLIESELFGHERGAFTGAVAMRQGRFELADGGTIFLDEVGDLAPELQAKLLRVLQEGEFERVGSSKTRRVDVRVIAATHRDLNKAVAEGAFRADLYYRLSVFPIALPPLRDRPEDIPRLVWFFIHRRQRELGRRINKVPPAVIQVLQHHDWPGNVRELENVVERAMIRSTDGTLQLDDPLCGDACWSPSQAQGDTLDTVQRCHIEKVLRACSGRINGANNAAVRLGIHPNTLRFRMKKLGVSVPRRQAGPPSQPSGPPRA